MRYVRNGHLPVRENSGGNQRQSLVVLRLEIPTSSWLAKAEPGKKQPVGSEKTRRWLSPCLLLGRLQVQAPLQHAEAVLIVASRGKDGAGRSIEAT